MPVAPRLALLVVLLAGCAVPEAAACEGTFEDVVERHVDGDTLDLRECGRLRLALVDTPERGEPGFEAASAFTAGHCPVGTRALVDLDAGQPVDTTGTRRVGVLACGGVNLNAALVEAGHAVILTHLCARSEFRDEDWARACRSE